MKNKFKSISFRDYGVLLGFIALCVIVSIIEPSFLSSRNLLNLLRQSSVIGIISVGMTFVIISGNFDISVGVVSCIAGAITMKFATQGMNIFLAMLIALVLCVGIGFLNGFVVAKIKVPSLIATMAMVLVVTGAVLLLTEGYPITASVPVLDFIGNKAILGIPVPVIIFAISLLIAHIVLQKTKFGRYVYSIGGNQEASKLNGINVDAYKIKVFMINAALAGVAGIVFVGRMGTASPIAGEGYDMDAIASVVIGGTSVAGGQGSVLKTAIGVLLMSVINNSFNLLGVDMYFQYIVKGGIILTAVGIDSYTKTRKA